jgi:hypothetical protein
VNEQKGNADVHDYDYGYGYEATQIENAHWCEDEP